MKREIKTLRGDILIKINDYITRLDADDYKLIDLFLSATTIDEVCILYNEHLLKPILKDDNDLTEIKEFLMYLLLIELSKIINLDYISLYVYILEYNIFNNYSNISENTKLLTIVAQLIKMYISGEITDDEYTQLKNILSKRNKKLHRLLNFI